MFISKETTDNHLSQKDFFRTARIFLRIFGIWPMKQGPLPILFYINFISLFFTAIFGVAHGFANLNNLYLALESFCGSAFELISWTKLAVVFYYRNELGVVLRTLLEYYTQDYRKEEIAIYRRVILYTMFSTVLLASGGLTTCTLYVFTPIFKNLFYFFTGQPLIREQPFQAVYPFIDQYTDKTFLPCFLHLSHGGYCTAIGFNGVDSIFITACFHIAAQFQLNAMKIRNIFNQVASNGILTKNQNQQLRNKLIDAIAEQVKLFELIDLFIKVFTSIILLHFISVAVIIGIGSIDFLIAPGLDKILYAVYILTVAIQSYAYAYAGNQISEHVEYSIKAKIWVNNNK
ncbi:odorant receptor 24a [Contarinia nasturtii]|uniref:odorant receptor 24a n=1 Tax=Contarinia nasturtii TaxID=265458 RepID=UPI0012D40778|nr:odorant receptor 24a [Contarinia nasturtii]